MTEKYQKIIKDIAIALVLILLVFIIDLAIIKFRSNLAENSESFNLEEENYKIVPSIKIEQGQKVFIPILNFHHIDQAPVGLGDVAKSFYIEPNDFKTILIDLLANEYRPVFVSEIIKYFEEGYLPEEKIMAITFDDGNEDFYTQAWPILQAMKIKSNMYVMTGVKGNDWLTSDQIKELDQSGLVEIGSHTVWHPYLTKISQEEQKRELANSKAYLEELLNKKVEVICYPFGLYNKQIKDLAQLVGYKAGLTFDQDTWQKSDDLMELKRISVYPDLNVMNLLNKLQIEK